MKLFHVYILKCADGTFYTGHTDNIEKRLSEHSNSHYKCYTSTRLPVELVWAQDFATRAEAIVAERQIKNWGQKKKIALINEHWITLQYLAKKNFK